MVMLFFFLQITRLFINTMRFSLPLRGSSEHGGAPKGNEAGTRLAHRDGIVAWLNPFLEFRSKADDPTHFCAGGGCRDAMV